MSRIHTNVMSIADQIRADLSIDNGAFVIPENAFEKTLPEGMTIDSVKAVQTQVNHFAAGIQYAAGQVGIDYMQQHPDCQQLTGTVQMGNDKLSMTFDRSRTIPADLNGGTKQVHGNMSAYHTVGGGAQQKHVRTALREMAHGKLGG